MRKRTPSNRTKKGDVFGLLTVIDVGLRFEPTPLMLQRGHTSGPTAVVCECTCGRRYMVREKNLFGKKPVGACRSCSRRQHEPIEEQLYRSWKSMRYQRRAPITPEWKSYPAFRTHVLTIGPRPDGHLFHRLDLAKPWEPGNIGWLTRSESARLICQHMKTIRTTNKKEN